MRRLCLLVSLLVSACAHAAAQPAPLTACAATEGEDLDIHLAHADDMDNDVDEPDEPDEPAEPEEADEVDVDSDDIDAALEADIERLQQQIEMKVEHEMQKVERTLQQIGGRHRMRFAVPPRPPQPPRAPRAPHAQTSRADLRFDLDFAGLDI